MSMCVIFVKQVDSEGVDIDLTYAWQVRASDDTYDTVFTKKCGEIPTDLGDPASNFTYRVCGTNPFGTTCSENARYEVLPSEEEPSKRSLGKEL